jgi:uncharacterized iron-regulated protein
MRSLLVLGLVILGGCGGRYPTKARRPPPATDDGPRGVAAAGLPYAIIDGHTGSAVAEPAFWSALEAATVVCVGEDHPNPHHHWAQLTVVEHLSGSRTKGFGLGLEMVQRPFQAVLDDYAAGRIDAAAMQSRVGWDDRWGYDWSLYEPVLGAAIAHGASVIALNAARELTKKVVHDGLDQLTVEERAGIAKDLVVDDAQHRAWFDEVMSDMGGSDAHSTSPNPHAESRGELAPPPPSADRIYLVQVIWDETMAETAARWVDLAGDRAMVILAGSGHCHDAAVVRRLQRRGVSPVISVRPIIDDGEGNVAEAILEKRNDYLFVMTMPQ